MTANDIEYPWLEIQARLEAGDAAGLRRLLDELPRAEIGRALSRLSSEQGQAVFDLLDPEQAADYLEALHEEQAAAIIENLPAPQAAAIADELESDHRADILAELDAEDAEAILTAMDPLEAADARELMRYAEHTAGGLMVTEFAAYPLDRTVGEVLIDMRERAEEYAYIGVQYLYVESPQGRLVGVVRLRDLLLSPAEKALAEIMNPNPLYLLAESPLEELDAFFERYPFYSAPVTDEDGRLVGVVRRADLEEALGEEMERNLLRFGGIIGGEERRDQPLRERATHRLVWLALNMVLSVIAASVILGYQETVAEVFALVFFMPIIANMSGCSGNQAVAVSIRELSLGLIRPRDYMRVWTKEVGVGIINGLVLGLAMGLLADLFWTSLSPALGVIIGVAFALNTTIAVSLGGLIPLALRRLNVDPALGAPPILTTLTDMCGFILVLTLARITLASGWI